MDPQHLLDIFPLEIWHLILANIHNSCDYFNLSAAANVFQHLLSNRRTTMLFPSVYKILINRCAYWDCGWSVNNTEHVESEFTHYDLHLKKSTKIRAVCSSWRIGVNHAMENMPHHYQFPDEPKNLRYLYQDDVDYYFIQRFNSTNDYPKFVHHFDPTHWILWGKVSANPFPTRTVVLDYNREQDPNRLIWHFLLSFDMLQKYGKHVWNMVIMAPENSSSDNQVALLLRLNDMLKVLPNLKVFRIIGRFDDLSKLQVGELTRVYMQKLPALPNLESVSASGIPLPLFRLIVIPHLAKLQQLAIELENEGSFEELFTIKFPCLAKFGLYMGNMSKISWKVIFEKLHKQFGNTLTDLYISLPGITETRSVTFPLRLPHLKVLQLEFNGTAMPLDFLLGVSSHMEEFRLRIGRLDATEINRLITVEKDLKLFGCIDKLKKSNIWKRFPNMKLVSVWTQNDYGPPQLSCRK